MFILLAANAAPAAVMTPPRRMLWVWERNTDLRFLKPEQAGVAFLAASISMNKGRVQAVPRLQPLLLSPGMYRMAVVRIDAGGDWSARSMRDCARIIENAFQVTRAQALQIDFDANSAAMPYYRLLAADVHRRIGPDVFLSLTMLASTCGHPAELTGFDANELVAMLFRTGPSGWTALAAPCRGAAGIALKGAHPPLKAFRRIYAFPDWYRGILEDWTPENVESFLKKDL